MKDSVVVAAEVPLEALFKQQDTLKMPGIFSMVISNQSDDVFSKLTSSKLEV